MRRSIENLETKVDQLQPKSGPPASQGQGGNSAQPGTHELKEAISGVERHMDRAKRIGKQAEDSLRRALEVAQEVTIKAGDVTVHPQVVHEELQDARPVYEDTIKLQDKVSRQTKTALTRMENLHGQVTRLAHTAAEEKKYYSEKAEAMRKKLTHKIEEAQKDCAAHISGADIFDTSFKMHADQAATIVEVAKAENERDSRHCQEHLEQATKLVQQQASQVWQWLQTAHKKGEDNRNNLQKLHPEVGEGVIRYEEEGAPKGSIRESKPGHC